MKFEYLLFDADNTLWDFSLSEKFALFKVVTENGVEYDPKHLEAYHKVNKACWHNFEKGNLLVKDLKRKRFELFCDEFDLELDATKMGKSYLQHLASTDFMIPGALNLLDRLARNHKLVMVTNGIKEVQRRRISNTAIESYFEVIVISDEIGVAKPHAGFFDYTFEQIGHPEKANVLMIGDSLSSDILGGNNYGITTCWFNPNKNEQNPEVIPSFEISTLEELIAIV